MKDKKLPDEQESYTKENHMDNYEMYDHTDPSDYGWIHEDDVPDLDHLKDMVEGMIDVVYRTGNIDSLERYLEEITCQLDLEIPHKKPLLRKKEEGRTTQLLESWVNLTQNYNEKLRKQATRL